MSWNIAVWTGPITRVNDAGQPVTEQVEIIADIDALRGLGRRALRNKNGKAKVGPFLARRLKEKEKAS